VAATRDGLSIVVGNGDAEDLSGSAMEEVGRQEERESEREGEGASEREREREREREGVRAS